MDSNRNPSGGESPQPITWISYLYTSFLYYFWLIYARLPQRITDDKSTEEQIRRDADTPRAQISRTSDETQTVRQVAGLVASLPAPKDSSLLSLTPPSSFDCNNCLTPHSSQKTCSPTYVSNLSLRLRSSSSSSKKKPSSTSSSTVSFHTPSRSSSTSSVSSESTISPKKVIAVVPSGSHVLVRVPKLDWKTESIRIKRTRMSDWLDAEQRDVMRQFDEVIRIEEEAEDQKTSSRGKKGILKQHYGSTRSIESIPSSSSRRSKSKETPVFVPPPPPPTDAMPYLPRLAELKKSTPDQEFGFNLHAERNRGHFIGTVDNGGIGQAAGLVIGQRIVGVNGELIYPNTGHKEVVSLIKKDNMKTTLLVASEDVDKYHRDHSIPYSWDNVERFAPEINVETYHEEVPVAKTNGYDIQPLNPHSIQVNEEREISKMTTTTKTETISSNTASYQYKESTTAYDAYAAPPAESGDLMDQVFGNVSLPTVGNSVTIHSHTEELPSAEDASSVSSLSSHRESAVDVPVSHQYVPSYATQSHQQHEQHSQTHHHHHHSQQQPSPLSNGSSHGYAASSTSGYDDDDIYHLSASEARERLRMKNRKNHLHEMSLHEKYQMVSNM
ncbi:hypothetical protein GCK72_013331 [Caenorhabditis remanei]|uniref:PDZ domain-containing protein n=1 Tax=Caenorhabditis remanei TaxID=31234 RepID=A0A6A5GNT5_CAERE|nr:hypothetical protein GCK72_013331 [Caenorhabditis remanei]KAF1756877.1 hypothetical protein GCK72_013331 [Caenorhabditis remanei]